MTGTYTQNPDVEFARNKKKAIKKNNGFCPGSPHIEEYRCPCKAFREKSDSGWCGEALYYKQGESEGESNAQ